MMYKKSLEYTENRLCEEQKRLWLNPTQTSQCLAKKALKYKKALHNFTKCT